MIQIHSPSGGRYHGGIDTPKTFTREYDGIPLTYEVCRICDGDGCKWCYDAGSVPTRATARFAREKVMGRIGLLRRQILEAEEYIYRGETYPMDIHEQVWKGVYPADAHLTQEEIARAANDKIEELKRECEEDAAWVVTLEERLAELDRMLNDIAAYRAAAKAHQRAATATPEQPAPTARPRSQCASVGCTRDVVVWDGDTAWCKRHGYEQGLMWDVPDIVEGE